MSKFSRFFGTSAIKAGTPRPSLPPVGRPAVPTRRPQPEPATLEARKPLMIEPRNLAADAGVKEFKPSEMRLLVQQALNDLGQHPHPEEVAGYLQAAAMLRVASELAELRKLLESGAAGVTVGIENGKSQPG